MRIRNVTVLGAGIMGRQISLLIATRGYKVFCFTQSEETLADAEAFARLTIDKRIEKGKLTEEEAKKILDRLTYTTDLETACESADFVIESVKEDIEIKKQILSQADKITPKHVIYATNSSYIVSSQLKSAITNESRLLNVHFFNPVAAMKVVEVVKGPHVSEECFDLTFDFIKCLGKTPIKIEKEIYGFVVNRIFSALTREACYLVDQNVASIEDIDNAVKGALGHAMGPLETLDLTGIDLEYNVYMDKFKKSGDLSDRPAVCLIERYSQGNYGRKTGKGFYEYPKSVNANKGKK